MTDQSNKAGLFIHGLRRDCDLCTELELLHAKIDSLKSDDGGGHEDGGSPDLEYTKAAITDDTVSKMLTFDAHRGLFVNSLDQDDNYGYDPDKDVVYSSERDGPNTIEGGQKIRVVQGNLVLTDKVGNYGRTIATDVDNPLVDAEVRIMYTASYMVVTWGRSLLSPVVLLNRSLEEVGRYIPQPNAIPAGSMSAGRWGANLSSFTRKASGALVSVNTSYMPILSTAQEWQDGTYLSLRVLGVFDSAQDVNLVFQVGREPGAVELACYSFEPRPFSSNVESDVLVTVRGLLFRRRDVFRIIEWSDLNTSGGRVSFNNAQPIAPDHPWGNLNNLNFGSSHNYKWDQKGNIFMQTLKGDGQTMKVFLADEGKVSDNVRSLGLADPVDFTSGLAAQWHFPVEGVLNDGSIADVGFICPSSLQDYGNVKNPWNNLAVPLGNTNVDGSRHVRTRYVDANDSLWIGMEHTFAKTSRPVVRENRIGVA